MSLATVPAGRKTGENVQVAANLPGRSLRETVGNPAPDPANRSPGVSQAISPFRARRWRDSDCPRRQSCRAQGMGAKYLPTIKDQKYNQRYHSKKNPLPVFRKDGVVGEAAKPVAPKQKAKS